LVSALLAASAHAEIVKVANVDCTHKAICFYWWPKLPSLPGWHADADQNVKNGPNGVSMLVPDGTDFSHAGAVMFGEAVYRPRYEWKNPNSKSLDAFIADDMAATLESHKDFKIAEAEPVSTADGQKLRSFTFVRSGECERVSYGVEGDYYLVFAIS